MVVLIKAPAADCCWWRPELDADDNNDELLLVKPGALLLLISVDVLDWCGWCCCGLGADLLEVNEQTDAVVSLSRLVRLVDLSSVPTPTPPPTRLAAFDALLSNDDNVEHVSAPFAAALALAIGRLMLLMFVLLVLVKVADEDEEEEEEDEEDDDDDDVVEAADEKEPGVLLPVPLVDFVATTDGFSLAPGVDFGGANIFWRSASLQSLS